MDLLHTASAWKARSRRVCLAIGVFDGVHLGHQRILRQAIEDAHACDGASVVVTFDRNPAAVIAPERAPAQICSLAHKLRTLAAFEPDATLLLRFDLALSQQPGEAFVRGLLAGFGHLHSICVGSSFTFGHRRTGTVGLLRQLGQELGFTVHGLEFVELEGHRVSSTRIREAIRAGDTTAASRLLGRPYELGGIVMAGDQLGRQLGFPTANMDVRGLITPPHGVYAVEAGWRDQTWRGVLNLGRRPSVSLPTPQLRAEVHLLGFAGDLYGEELRVRFLRKIREEQRFESLEALQAQIQRDVAGCA